MNFTTAPIRREIVEKAEKLARECLAPRAAHYDEAGTHPRERWRDLWESGLLAMTVPAEYGGLGLDMLTYCMVMEKLAGGCTNTAMTAHMHCTVMRFIEVLATPQQKATLYPQVVEEGNLFGSWGSEPAVSLTRNFLVQATIEPVDGGYLINGVKHFCTMAGAASYFMVWCALNGSADMNTGLVQALVPANSPGWRTTSGWDTLGMRATVSPSVQFANCFVAQDLILGQPGDGLKVGQMEGFGLGYAAIYLGAATAALEFATEYCKTTKFWPNPTAIADDPTIQRHLGETSIQLEAARQVL